PALPARQVNWMHLPPAVRQPCAPQQSTPQPPQAPITSHPFARLLPSQSLKPLSQVPLHEPAAQVGLAMWLFEQAMPQPPQLAALVWVFTSQPLVFLLLSQSAKLARQAPLHTPAPHAGVMLAFEHTEAQPPQL